MLAVYGAGIADPESVPAMNTGGGGEGGVGVGRITPQGEEGAVPVGHAWVGPAAQTGRNTGMEIHRPAGRPSCAAAPDGADLLTNPLTCLRASPCFHGDRPPGPTACDHPCARSGASGPSGASVTKAPRRRPSGAAAGGSIPRRLSRTFTTFHGERSGPDLPAEWLGVGVTCASVTSAPVSGIAIPSGVCTLQLRAEVCSGRCDRATASRGTLLAKRLPARNPGHRPARPGW